MSLLDIMLIGILITFTLVSAAWGFIRQSIALAGLLGGIWLAGLFSPQLANSLGFIPERNVAVGAAFVLIVVVISALASTVASVLYFASGLLFLGLFDHLLGAFLGFIQGIFASGVFIIAVLTFFPDWSRQQLAQSFLANQAAGVLTTITLFLAPQELKDLIERARTRL